MSQGSLLQRLGSLLPISSQPTPVLPSYTRHPSPHSWDQSTLAEKQSVSTLTDERSSLPLAPSLPTRGDRYTRKRMIPGPRTIVFNSGPLPIQTFDDILYGWEEDIHPEGQPLYSKVVSSQDLKVRVHTDLPLRLPHNHAIISNATDQLVDRLDACSNLHTSGLKSAEIDACLVVRSASPTQVGYYLANHRDQTIFWLELEGVDPDSLGLHGPEAIVYQHKLTTEYWRHVTDFPHHCSLPQKVWDQLGPSLLIGAVDGQFCQDSTASQDPQTISRLESFWRQAKKERDADGNKATCNWICARLWYDLVSIRAHNYWGTNYARLEKTTVIGDDVLPSQEPLSWYTRLAFWTLLWNEPVKTMKVLDSAWPGGLIYAKNWTDMVKLFTAEWERNTLLSAITFVGSTTFLTLLPSQTVQGSSLLASLSTVSTLACSALSLSSLIGSLSLSRAFRGKISYDVHEAGAWVHSLYSSSLGHFRWGILFSLPTALLKWAFVFFCGALLTSAIQLQRSRMELFLAEAILVVILAMVSMKTRRWLPRLD